MDKQTEEKMQNAIDRHPGPLALIFLAAVIAAVIWLLPYAKRLGEWTAK